MCRGQFKLLEFEILTKHALGLFSLKQFHLVNILFCFLFIIIIISLRSIGSLKIVGLGISSLHVDDMDAIGYELLCSVCVLFPEMLI